MQCAISGVVPQHPVASKKTGHVFEKQLITQFLAADEKCPVTKQELTLDDLIELTGTGGVPPRPPSATSLPGLLSSMQSEWDAVMLESYAIKQALDQTRQDLSQALYQNDAACRVIARLVRERDEAREELEAQRQLMLKQRALAPELEVEDPLNGQMDVDAEAEPEVPAQEEPLGITQQVLDQLDSKWKELSKKRKKRAIPEQLTPSTAIGAWQQTQSFTLHKTTAPGITSLDLHPDDDTLVVTGGVDKTAIVFRRDTQQELDVLTGHTKKVTAVLFHPSSNVIFTTSADKSTKMWRANDDHKYTVARSWSDHTEEVTGVTLHPTKDYFATSSLDGGAAFYDIPRGVCLKTYRADEGGPLSCAKFHPDGLIMGTGEVNSTVRIWDMKSQDNVANFPTEHPVSSICFSENGYYMAAGCQDGGVRMFDLRKLKCFKTLETGHRVTSVDFDHSGSYLASGGASDVRVWQVKEWTELLQTGEYTKPVSQVKWGTLAGILAVGAMDRTLTIYGAAGEE